ncbi:hypothetical protein PCE1_001299 [Barthelona sp. PCE]
MPQHELSFLEQLLVKASTSSVFYVFPYELEYLTLLEAAVRYFTSDTMTDFGPYFACGFTSKYESQYYIERRFGKGFSLKNLAGTPPKARAKEYKSSAPALLQISGWMLANDVHQNALPNGKIPVFFIMNAEQLLSDYSLAFALNLCAQQRPIRVLAFSNQFHALHSLKDFGKAFCIDEICVIPRQLPELSKDWLSNDLMVLKRELSLHRRACKIRALIFKACAALRQQSFELVPTLTNNLTYTGLSPEKLLSFASVRKIASNLPSPYVKSFTQLRILLLSLYDCSSCFILTMVVRWLLKDARAHRSQKSAWISQPHAASILKGVVELVFSAKELNPVVNPKFQLLKNALSGIVAGSNDVIVVIGRKDCIESYQQWEQNLDIISIVEALGELRRILPRQIAALIPTQVSSLPPRANRGKFRAQETKLVEMERFCLFVAEEDMSVDLIKLIDPDRVFLMHSSLKAVRVLEIFLQGTKKTLLLEKYEVKPAETNLERNLLKAERDWFAKNKKIRLNVRNRVVPYLGPTNVQHTVIVDSRELRASFPLELLKAGFDINIQTLFTADYIVSDTVGVERKAIVDLVQSIDSGRLHKQCVRLAKKYDLPILLIEMGSEGLVGINSWSVLFPQHLKVHLVRTLLSVPQLRVCWGLTPHASALTFKFIKEHLPNAQSNTSDRDSVRSPSSLAQDIVSLLPGFSKLDIGELIRTSGQYSLFDFSRMSKNALEGIVGRPRAKEINTFMDKNLEELIF